MRHLELGEEDGHVHDPETGADLEAAAGQQPRPEAPVGQRRDRGGGEGGGRGGGEGGGRRGGEGGGGGGGGGLRGALPGGRGLERGRRRVGPNGHIASLITPFLL